MKNPEPPMLLDAALVLEYAPFDAQMLASPSASAVVGGVAVDLTTVAGLAIVEGLARGERFILHCNDEWETLAAGGVSDIASTKALAETSYPGVTRLWRPFRGLTADEQREIASTRAFLQELLAQDHGA